jgi:hypothetical protein
MLDDKEALSIMGKNAKKYVNLHHNWKDTAEIFIKLYKEPKE